MESYVNGKEIYKLFNVSSETIKEWIDNKNFPKPLVITNKTRLWNMPDVIKWSVEQSHKKIEGVNNEKRL